MDTFSKLSKRERQILQVLLRLKEASAREVQDQIPNAPTNAAVRRMLAILEEKGYIGHRAEGLKFIYFPRLDMENERDAAIANLKDTFFSGSASQALAAIIDTSIDELSEADLAEIEELIKKARREEK